jgi:2-methylcitrate dehydratase PrpD
MGRVSFVHPPEAAGYEGMERYPETVTITLRDGTVYAHEVNDSKGKPGNRMREAELATKFRDCAEGVIPAKRIERSLEMLHALDKLRNIGELMDVLCDVKYATASRGR